MVYRATHIKDILGNNYIGIDIQYNLVYPFLTRMKDELGSLYDEYVNNQMVRDNNKYHLTVISTLEYNDILKHMGVDKFASSLELVFEYDIDDLKFMGLGLAKRNENTAYFIVCRSDKVLAIRNRFGLDNKDLHITIGFRHKDVHGVPKDTIITPISTFIKKVSSYFVAHENWDFIKKIDNYDINKSTEIVPIDITDTRMKIRVGDVYMDIGWVDDLSQFRVLTKYPVIKSLPRLPKTEILKKLFITYEN
jgi:hypothetical protein